MECCGLAVALGNIFASLLRLTPSSYVGNLCLCGVYTQFKTTVERLSVLMAKEFSYKVIGLKVVFWVVLSLEFFWGGGVRYI